MAAGVQDGFQDEYDNDVDPLNDVVEVKLSFGDESESILLCPGIPVADIAESMNSLFPSLPSAVKGLREVRENESLGPFIPLQVVAKAPIILKPDMEYRVQVMPTWRKEDIKYAKNEVHVDVVEQINLKMSIEDLGNGNSRMIVLNSDVCGALRMRCQLSGMPGIKLCFEKKEFMERTFHPCVKLDKFEANTMKLIPPDGETELMRYRVQKFVKLPFRVMPTLRLDADGNLDISVRIKANFSAKLTATDVVVKIPTPPNTIEFNIAKVSKGKMEYIRELEAILWKIPKFSGDCEHFLGGKVSMLDPGSNGEVDMQLPPLVIDFQLMSFAASGFHVKYLEVYENSNYTRDNWVRYITTAGSYEIQMASPGPA